MKKYTTPIFLSVLLSTQIALASNNDKGTKHLITTTNAEVLAIMAQREAILNDTHNGPATSQAKITLITNEFCMRTWQTSGKVSSKDLNDFETTKFINQLLLEAVLAINLKKSPQFKK